MRTSMKKCILLLQFTLGLLPIFTALAQQKSLQDKSISSNTSALLSQLLMNGIGSQEVQGENIANEGSPERNSSEINEVSSGNINSLSSSVTSPEINQAQSGIIRGIMSSALGQIHRQEEADELRVNTTPISRALTKKVLENAPEEIAEVVSLWKDRNELELQMIPKQLILCGPSGNGKTTLGKAIAQECGLPFFLYRAAGIATKFKDSGTQNLEKIFSDAALNAPCVVIIDELGALLKKYENENDTEQGMLMNLWTLLDSIEEQQILVIFTLNDVDNMPLPMKTRFTGELVTISSPDLNQREEVIKHYTHTAKKNYFDEIDAKELANKTNGFSSRELKKLTRLAFKMAYKRNKSSTVVKMNDFLEVLHRMNVHNNKMKSKDTQKKVAKLALQWAPTVIASSLTIAGLYQASNYQKQNMRFQRDIINSQKGGSLWAWGVASQACTTLFGWWINKAPTGTV